MNEVIHLFLNPLVFVMMFIGVIAGIIVGALPGLTATMGVALLLPFTFWMKPLEGMMLLLGIYIGAMYGGAISAILIRTPGTPAAAATSFDGYPLSKSGKAGLAIGISCITSVIGGVFSTIILMLIAPQIAKFALKFGPFEYFALAVFGLSIISSISFGSLTKGLIVGLAGMFISTIGLDPILAFPRFTFSSDELLNGVSYIPLMIGVFAIAEALEQIGIKEKFEEVTKTIGRILPNLSELKKITPATFLACIIGTIVGAIPGAGGDIAAFVSYDQAKKISKNKDEFGKGSIEGLSASECANNSVTGGAMIPMMTLGIPGDSVTAVLLGAFLIQGLRPGPLLFKEQAVLVNSIFIGLLMANLIVLPIGLFGAKLIARTILIPKHYLWPLVIVLCLVGSYSVENSMFSVGITILFGIIGYIMKKFDFPPGPLILGVILGPMAESNLRRGLISEGSLLPLFTHPISLFLLILTLFSLIFPIIQDIRAKKER